MMKINHIVQITRIIPKKMFFEKIDNCCDRKNTVTSPKRPKDIIQVFIIPLIFPTTGYTLRKTTIEATLKTINPPKAAIQGKSD